jgi:hypothetical protein
MCVVIASVRSVASGLNAIRILNPESSACLFCVFRDTNLQDRAEKTRFSSVAPWPNPSNKPFNAEPAKTAETLENGVVLRALRGLRV